MAGTSTSSAATGTPDGKDPSGDALRSDSRGDKARDVAAGDRDDERDRPARPVDLALLVVFCGGVFFAGLGQPSLWEPDEPRFIESSREMLERGDWLTPWFNGEPRFHKPILLYWMQLAAILLLGVGELAARLPAALAGTASVLLLYLLGLRLGSRRMALLAALALATTFRVVVYARHGLTDVPLLASVMAGIYCLVRSAEATASSRPWALLAWASMGLGVLTKGPVGMLPLIVWVPYVATFDRAAMKRMVWGRGVLTLAFVSLPWFVAMVAVHGAEYLQFALLSEFVARFAEEGAHGPGRGLFYYFKVWPADLAPWTLLFVAGVVSLGSGWRRLGRADRRTAVLGGTWFVLVLALFSLSQGKLPHYIIPLYPAATLLIGLSVDAAARGTVPTLPLWIAGGLTAALLTAAALLAWRFEERFFDSTLSSPGVLFPAALLLGAVTLVIAVARRRQATMVTGLAVSSFAAYLVLALWLVPQKLESYKPVPELSRAIVEVHQPGQRIALYGDLSGQGFVYYTRRRIEWLAGIGEVRELFARDSRSYLVTRGDALPAIRDAVPTRLHVLAEEPLLFVRLEHLLDADPRDDRRTLVVLSNQPAR